MGAFNWGLQSAGSPYDGMYQQQQAAWLQNVYQTYTTGNANTVSITVAAPVLEKAEPDEFAWLKRRVREIEWRA